MNVDLAEQVHTKSSTANKSCSNEVWLNILLLCTQVEEEPEEEPEEPEEQTEEAEDEEEVQAEEEEAEESVSVETFIYSTMLFHI